MNEHPASGRTDEDEVTESVLVILTKACSSSQSPLISEEGTCLGWVKITFVQSVEVFVALLIE